METEQSKPNKAELQNYLKVFSYLRSKLEFQKKERERVIKSPYLKDRERTHEAGRLFQLCDTLEMFGYYEAKIKKNLAN